MIVANTLGLLNFFKISKFFLYLALFSVIFVSTETLFPFIVTKYVFFRVAVGLALISFLFGWLFLNREESKSFEAEILKRLKSPLVLSISLFVFIFLIAGFWGFNPQNSFWSNFERGEGSFQLLSLYVFLLLLTFLFREEKDWLKIFKVSLFSALLIILYGILASIGFSGFIGQGISSEVRFSGSLGNPAYLGTYLMFVMAFAVYILAYEKNLWWRVSSGVLLVFYSIFFWLAQTRGSFLGLAAGVFLFLFFLILKSNPQWRRRMIVAAIVLFLFAAGTFSFVQSLDYYERPTWIRWISIDLGGVSFQSRLWTWGSALEGLKERPLLGWGPENFGRAFDKYFDPQHFIPGVPSDTWYDRAHNLFLDYLVAAGLLGLLGFVSIFTVFYVRFFNWVKKFSAGNKKPLVGAAIFFALPAAYLVQGIVIFDVLPIYINLFLFFAFADFKFHESFD